MFIAIINEQVGFKAVGLPEVVRLHVEPAMRGSLENFRYYQVFENGTAERP
jgi:hypothetical protein